MTSYTATLNGYRIATLIQGDTIERVAARELGDAAQWKVLAGVNALVWPFITDDPAAAGDGVLLSIGTIRVPASQPASPSAVTDDTVFGTDLLMTNGQLQVVDGDLATVSGIDNLKAAVVRRILVKLAELPYHPLYGCLVRTLVGKGSNPVHNQLAAAYVARAINADPRIDHVESATADLTGDQILVSAQAVTVSGKPLPTGKINVPN